MERVQTVTRRTARPPGRRDEGSVAVESRLRTDRGSQAKVRTMNPPGPVRGIRRREPDDSTKQHGDRVRHSPDFSSPSQALRRLQGSGPGLRGHWNRGHDGATRNVERGTPREATRTGTVQNSETHEESRTLSLQERTEILEEYLAQAGLRGWRVEGKGDYIAFLASGKPVNHKRHALTALLTGGLWLRVWAGMSIFGGEKRMLVRVDGLGNLHGPPIRR